MFVLLSAFIFLKKQTGTQIYSGIACGRVLNGKLYAQMFQKLIYPHRRQMLTFLHIFTNLFRREIFPHSPEYLQS